MPGNVLLALAGFCLGIVSRSLVPFPWEIIAISALIFSLSFFCWLLARRPIYLSIALVLLAFALGAGRVAIVPQALPGPFLPLIGTDVSFEATIIADPDIRETSQRVMLRVEKGGKTTKMLAVAALYPEVRYGERVRVRGTLTEPEPFETNGGRIFRYDRFFAKDGMFALVERATLEGVAPRTGIGMTVMGALLDGRHAFIDALASALPEPAASLAAGLIAGGKQGLGKDLLDAFVVSGLVHIVVLSGYNVMIVAEFVLKSLAFLPKRIAATAAGIVIVGFVLAAGAGSASLRAGLMSGLALVARATGRTYDVVRAVLVVGALMLLWNPLLLVYDPGFQLSFLATLGLILGAPLVARRLAFIGSPLTRDLLSATIAAQVSVLPLLLYQTGLFSLVSLPANLIVLPFVPLAMALSGVAGFVGLVLPPLAPLAGLPAYAILSSIIAMVQAAAALPLASVSIPQFPFALVVLAYLVLAAIVWKSAPSME